MCRNNTQRTANHVHVVWKVHQPNGCMMVPVTLVLHRQEITTKISDIIYPFPDLSPRFSFLYWENTENFIKILRISVYKYGEICTPQNRSKWHSQASYDIMKPFLWIKPSIQINRWAIPHKISHFLFHGGSKKSHLPVRFYFHLQWQKKRLRQDYVMSHWL